MHLLTDFIGSLHHDAPPWLWTGLSAAVVMAVTLLVSRVIRAIAKRATRTAAFRV